MNAFHTILVSFIMIIIIISIIDIDSIDWHILVNIGATKTVCPATNNRIVLLLSF